MRGEKDIPKVPVRACPRWAFVVWLSASLTGCLPTGNPPAGRHWVSDRTMSGVYFAPSEVEGVPSHVLVAGPVQVESGLNKDTYSVAALYQVDDHATSGTTQGLPRSNVLFSHCFVPDGDPAKYPVKTDILGRLLVENFVAAEGKFDVYRIDLTNYAQKLLGGGNRDPNNPGNSLFRLSPGRTRVLVGQSWPAVTEIDDLHISLGPSANHATFVGEDLYYGGYAFISGPLGIAPNYESWDVLRLVPHGQPEVLAKKADLAFAFASSEGPHLVIERTALAQDGDMSRSDSVLDPQTLQEIPLPSVLGLDPDSSVNPEIRPVSPDGHWLILWAATGANNFAFFNWITSETQDAVVSWSSRYNLSEWRPGREEFWFSGSSDSSLWSAYTWKPDTALSLLPTWPTSSYLAPTGPFSAFTRSGNHWFSYRWIAEQEQSALFVGSTDNPDGPAFQLRPPVVQLGAGTTLDSHWELADGRLLTGGWSTDLTRLDYYLVDPNTGASQTFAIQGQVIAVGHARALSFVNWQLGYGTGDLDLIDLTTGARTLLAENAYAVAVDPGTHAEVPLGSDALASGTRIAFLVRNRMDSPYDGLWVAELP